MRPKSLILLSLALGCGLIATLGINQVMSKGSPVAAPEGEKVEIFVAVNDIGTNDMITAEHLQLEEWPKDRAPADALTTLEAIVGRRAKTQFMAGDLMREGKLYVLGEDGRATNLITPGSRVVALKVNAESTGGYIIKPGDRVDLMVYLRKDPTLGIDKTMAKTFLQNVKVFAIGGVVTEEEGDSTKNYQHLTVELTPEEADVFKLASYLGQIDLSVRASGDDKIVEAGEADADVFLKSLLGQKEDVAAAPNEEPKEDPKAETPAAIPGIEDLAAELGKDFAPQVEDPWTIQVVMGSEVQEYTMKEGSWVAEPTYGATTPGGAIAPEGAAAPAGDPALEADDFMPEDDASAESDEEFDLNSILDN